MTFRATTLGGTVIKFWVTVDYTAAGQLSFGQFADAVDAGSGTGGGAALGLASTCAQYLAASAAAHTALVDSIRTHLGVTFGSATTSTYVTIFDTDCPAQPGRTIQQLLVNLGYYQ